MAKVIRYCVKYYINGMPFPYKREFRTKKTALDFISYLNSTKGKRDGIHDVELVDYRNTTI